VKLLVIDDDPNIAQAIKLAFSMQWQGVEVRVAYDGSSGLDAFFETQPHVILLDVGLPGGMSGFEVLEKIRQISDVPVLMLSAHGQELDKVRGLELGADDYITKPFGHLELLARVRAVLRRAELPPPVSAVPDLQAGDLTINFGSREVQVKGELVKLTPVEYGLLYHLARNAGHVLTHDALLTKVWGDEYQGEADYLKVYISRLRAKLGEDPAHPQWIETVPRLGYRFLRPTTSASTSENKNIETQRGS
jgi:DNA-binding response OmpR family regulator